MISIFPFFKKISEAKWFDNFITIIILAAGIVVGLQTSPVLTAKYGTILGLLDQTILLIFVIEILINTLAEGNRPWRYFYDNWHIFDFTIVALCFLPYLFPNSNTEFFAVFRLARILRLAKIFEKIQNLRVLLVSLMKSMPKMSYVLMLLALLFYIYGVIATDLFGKFEPAAFGSIWLSMKQLFFVTFEGWSWVEELDGIKLMLDNGYPDWVLVLFFGSFLFMSAMIFLNLFIGIITSDMESAKAEEKRGKARIYKSGHTLILGWSMNVYKIIAELIEANDSKEKAYIVILADREKEEMEYDIESRFPKTGTTKVICRSGSTAELSNLEVVNAWNAKSIIALSDSDSNDPDLNTLKSIIALINHSNNIEESTFHIAAEMKSPKMIKTAKSIASGKVVFFESDEFLSALIAQTCLQPRLSTVYSEITGFEGNELYIVPANSSQIGKKFKDILFEYRESCPIGIIESDKTVLNPKMDTIIGENTQLVILAEDDSCIKTGKYNFEINNKLINTNKNIKKLESGNMLILGSNSKLPRILKEINDYLHSNCLIKIISNSNSAYDEVLSFFESLNTENSNYIYTSSISEHIELSHLKIEFITGDIDDYDTIEQHTKGVSHVTILSYFGVVEDIQQADAVTLVTLIHLRNAAKSNNRKFSITTEIIDDNNRELINNPDVCDFIISSNLISSILAQLSEEKRLCHVFGELFRADGSEIYIRKISNYCSIGNKINFATLVESAALKNETAIGYVKENLVPEFIINPLKDVVFEINENDSLIVLAED